MAKQHNTFFESEIDRLYAEGPFRREMYLKVRQSKIYMEKLFIRLLEGNKQDEILQALKVYLPQIA